MKIKDHLCKNCTEKTIKILPILKNGGLKNKNPIRNCKLKFNQKMQIKFNLKMEIKVQSEIGKKFHEDNEN